MSNLPFEEKVWVDGGRKFEGVCRDIAHAFTEGTNVLLLAHFEDTLSALASMLSARSLRHQTHFDDDGSSLCASNGRGGGPKVWLALASHFRAQGSTLTGAARESRVLILVAEHHPLASKDQSVLEAASRVPCPSKIIFHTSLADPLLKRFGGDRLRGLLKQLGHREDECVSHPLIGAAIRKAQEKIGTRVAGEMPTRSAGEWFEYNLRGER